MWNQNLKTASTGSSITPILIFWFSPIVLFIDDPKIHTTRLHRILRNLCYHAPTRDWVVKSLLSILEKSNDKQTLQGPADTNNSSDVQPPAKIRKSTSKSNTFSADLSMGKDKSTAPPSWLNISMDAALGFRANVFQVFTDVYKTHNFKKSIPKNSWNEMNQFEGICF